MRRKLRRRYRANRPGARRNFQNRNSRCDRGCLRHRRGHEWILCVRRNEALSDDLEAALLEWKQKEPPETAACYSVPIRENAGGWQKGPPEVRLVNRKRMNWVGEMPPAQLLCEVLSGDVCASANPTLTRGFDRTLGPTPRMRAVRDWSGLRELPECLHQPHSARRIRSLAAFPLPPLRRAHPLVRQHPCHQLDHASWPLPQLRPTHLVALPGGRTADRGRSPPATRTLD